MNKVKDIIIEVFKNNMGDDGILTLPLEKIAEELNDEICNLIAHTTIYDVVDLF